MDAWDDSGFNTRAIHAGQEPDPLTGAVVPPVYQVSTFAQDGVGGLRNGYEYSRSGNPTRTALEECLVSLEAPGITGARGLAFASGLAAEDTLLRVIGTPGGHAVIGNDTYGGTYRLFSKVAQPWGLDHTAVDLTNLAAVKAAIVPGRTSIVWAETPTNPLLTVFDIAALAEVAHAAGAVLVIDNTFASPWACQPLTMGVDLVITPSEGARKKMLLADMDSTMIQQECIDELADEAGVGDRVKEITARAMNGELDFEMSVVERVALLKGLPESIISEVLASRISFMPGGLTLLATMKANGAYAALVSGGFTAFTASVSNRLGFDEHRANILQVNRGLLTGEVEMPVLGKQSKVDALEEITLRLGLDDAAVLAVGDGANDLAMLHRAGTGVALHAKPAVSEQCKVRVNFGDLTALLYLQGYFCSEFKRVP